MHRILIVDDEEMMRKLIRKYAEFEGCTVTEAADGMEAVNLCRRENFDIIILDIMMPGLDGLSVCRILRKDSDTPIIFLTALSDEEDKLMGYELGADDYVTKPFNPIVLGAKVKALIRRSKGSLPGTDSVITAGPFRYNTSTLRFYKNGAEVILSSKENAIIKLFMDNVNRIFSKDMIYDLIWGEAIIDENAIMVYVNRLRHKIEDDPAKPRYIQNVRGVGYRFVV